MYFTRAFMDLRAEPVDVLDLSRKMSVPGESIPETVAQSQVECFLVRKGDTSLSAPTTTQDTMYRCYLLDGETPEVSQLIKRADGERLTILTKPEKYDNIIFFDCQHKS